MNRMKSLCWEGIVLGILLFTLVIPVSSIAQPKIQQSSPAPANFEVDGSTYPWEVHDEGISLILDNMTSMAGINAVYVLAVMHKEHRPFLSVYTIL